MQNRVLCYKYNKNGLIRRVLLFPVLTQQLSMPAAQEVGSAGSPNQCLMLPPHLAVCLTMGGCFCVSNPSPAFLKLSTNSRTSYSETLQGVMSYAWVINSSTNFILL